MPMKICDRCGAQLEDNAKFCCDCGAKQEPKKIFCSHCGTELNPNAKFCSECGTPAAPVQPDKPEDKKQEASDELVGLAKEIKEQGGIIVYNDQDENEITAAKKLLADLDPDMGCYLSDDFNLRNLIDNCIKTAKLKFKKFGEPGRNIQDYGYPDDDYRGKIEYAILDNEKLILRGEGNTFRILSDEDQKKSEENFWVLNTAIQKLKNQIDTILIDGDDMSLRARLFKDFSQLDTVILGKGVDGIRFETFAGCPVRNLVLPTTIWHLVESAFIGAKFKSFFIPPLSTEGKSFIQFQSESIVDCKELKYVFLPQRLYEARDVSKFFKGCDNLDVEKVWYVKDFNTNKNHLLTIEKNMNQKEKTMEKFIEAREGFNKSLEKAKEADEKNYPVIGFALRKMGEDPEADEHVKEYADDGKIFIATDGDSNFTAFDHLTWDEIEDELKSHPEYTELYYTDAFGEGVSESAEYLLDNEWPECEAGTDQAVSAVLAGKEDEWLYEGDSFPSIKIEMFYNGNLFHTFTL